MIGTHGQDPRQQRNFPSAVKIWVTVFESWYYYIITTSKLWLSLRNVTTAFLGLGHLALGTYRPMSSRGVWGHFRRVWNPEGGRNGFIFFG
jgi:hypothetical protein